MTPQPKPIRASKVKRPIPRKARVKKRKTTKRGTLVRQCDKLWSEIVKLGAMCIMSRELGATHECKGTLQAMHGLSRRYHGTRWELINGFAGCQAVHFRYTREPMAWTRWLIERWGLVHYDQLWRQAQAGKPKDMNAVLSGLKERLELRQDVQAGVHP